MVLLITTSVIAYIALEYTVRYLCLRDLYLGKAEKYKYECYKDIIFFVSPGFWFARYFKKVLKQSAPDEQYKDLLKRYIVKNNHYNIAISVALLFAVSISYYLFNGATYLLGVVIYRFISRSVEIIVAFGKDVTSNKDKNSSLSKYDRIKLAIKSYFEVFVFSSTLYMFMPQIKGIDAIFVSLGTGTFTTVSNHIKLPSYINMPYETTDLYLMNIALFTQIFTTLSLVVLSLALYVSSEE
jgi:hypothetical protein